MKDLSKFQAFKSQVGGSQLFELSWRAVAAGDTILSTRSNLNATVNVRGLAAMQVLHVSVLKLTSTRLSHGRVSRYYIPSWNCPLAYLRH